MMTMRFTKISSPSSPLLSPTPLLFSSHLHSHTNPLYRITRPMTFASIAINFAATTTLLGDNRAVHRQTGLKDHQSINYLVRRAADAFTMETFPQWVRRKGLPDKESHRLPLVEDGLRVWAIFSNFTQRLVDIYFGKERTTKELLKSNATKEHWSQIKQYWLNVNRRYHDPEGHLGLRLNHDSDSSPSASEQVFYRDKPEEEKVQFDGPDRIKDGRKNKNYRDYGMKELKGSKHLALYLAHSLFGVTAWHEVLGNAAEYTNYRGTDTRM